MQYSFSHLSEMKINNKRMQGHGTKLGNHVPSLDECMVLASP